MRGSLRVQLFSALVLPPIIATAVLTIMAIRLFREDKELYVYDSSAQTVDLVAGGVESKLQALKLQAELSRSVVSPFLSVTRSPAGQGSSGSVRLENVSQGEDARVRIRYAGQQEDLVIEVRPEALLDLRGRAGAGRLMLVNQGGRLLVHPQTAQVLERKGHQDLLGRLRLFEPGTPRVSTRALDLEGTPSLVAAARLPGAGAAVVQATPRQEVFAAAQPLVTRAALTAAVVVLVVVLVGLLLGRIIIRPLRLMAGQAAAIARGEFGVETEAGAAGDVGRLAESLNTMSAALKRRDGELSQLQHQLLQAERLNTAGRMVSKVARDLTGPVDTCFSLANQTLRRLSERSELRGLQEQIAAEADRAANILQNLLRVAEREDEGEGEGESVVREVDLEMLMADVLVSAGPLLDRRGLVLATEPELNGSVVVRLPSPDHLRSAFLDLLLHVAEAATKGSTVTISCAGRDGRADLGIRFVGQGGTSPGQSSLVLAVAGMAVEEQGGELRIAADGTDHRLDISLPLAGGGAVATNQSATPAAGRE